MLVWVRHRTWSAMVGGWRRAITLRADDTTGRSAGASCIVLAAHPDDETIGCGATIARKRAAGTPVTVVVATDGRYSTRSYRVSEGELAAIRVEELRRAADVLCVSAPDVVVLPHDDLSLVLSMETLVSELEELVAHRGIPDEIFVTSARDGHPDHVALNEAARQLRRVVGEECRFLEYQTWYWYAGPGRSGASSRLRRWWRTFRRLARSARATRAVKVSTRGFLGDKRRALACYASQTTNLTGEPGWQTLPAEFLACFLGAWEVFFPVLSASPRREP
jgi:LmbE family N-acetylglucosaminyl deacetylase